MFLILPKADRSSLLLGVFNPVVFYILYFGVTSLYISLLYATSILIFLLLYFGITLLLQHLFISHHNFISMDSYLVYTHPIEFRFGGFVETIPTAGIRLEIRASGGRPRYCKRPEFLLG